MAVPRAARFIYGRRHSLDPQAPTADYLSDAKLFRRSVARTIGPSAGQPIDSETIWFISHHVGFFRLVSNSFTEAVRSEADAAADQIDGVVIDYVAAGRYHVISRHGENDLRPGDLGLMQSTIGVTARAERVTLSSLFLPRTRLVEEAGSDFLAPAYRIRGLGAAPLAPFLSAQLDLLQRLCGKLPEAAFTAALECAADLAVALLRGEVEQARAPSVSATLARAIAHLQRDFHRHALEPEEVARALGLSRARLYREFADHGLTVMGYLKDLRLRRFVELLRERPAVPISQLAWDCGFDMNSSDFARLFRAAYGLTPGEARLALQSDPKLLG